MSWKRVERGIRCWTSEDGSRTYHVDVIYRERRRTGRARTQEKARQLKARLLSDLMEAAHFPEKAARIAKRIRLSDFIERYQEDYLAVKATRSMRQVLSCLKAIEKGLGNPFLDSITTSDLQHFLAGGLRSGWSPATYNRYRTRLHSLLRKAVDWDLLTSNPAVRLERLRESKMGDRYLTDLELERLLSACDRAAEREGKDGPNPKASIRPLVALAALTGMRQGELMGLRWEDFEPDLAFVTLRGSQTKTGEPRRVPLVAEARRVVDGMGMRQGRKVWPWKQFPRKQWERAIRDLGWHETDVARLRGWRFHDMRHAAASRMVMSGMSLYKVGKVLGHTQAETTQRYAHLAPGSLVEDMERAFDLPSARPESEWPRTGHKAELGESSNSL